MKSKNKYLIRYKRDANGWWVAEIHEMPVASQGRTIEQARKRVINALTTFLNVDISKKTFEDEIQLPTHARKVFKKAKELMIQAEAAQIQAEAARARLIQVLKNHGLSMRSIGRLLGVTRQRVHQLGKP